MKILVIHHVRRLENFHIYQSDDFALANNEVYGAQELDTWAGIRMFSKNHEVWRLEICPNESQVRLLNQNGEVVTSKSIRFLPGTKSLKNSTYLKSLVKYADSSVAFFSREELIQFVNETLSSWEFDLLWWETQFYDSLIPKGFKSIVRSVNFEPSHVLAEDSSRFKYLRFISKLISERKISRTRKIVAISPLDALRYKGIGASECSVLPLRQLPYISESKFLQEDFSDSFLFFGSNFEIRHNLLNLRFIINELAPLMLREGITQKIAIFGHRIPPNLELPGNVVYKGFAENLQGKQLGSLGVIVPYHGGAGMQSKIFEPLVLGVPIIANPENFAGFDFVQGQHFYSASNIEEYLEGVSYFLNNRELTLKMGTNAKQKSVELFSRAKYDKIINELISEV